jgi:hypothetical protein
MHTHFAAFMDKSLKTHLFIVSQYNFRGIQPAIWRKYEHAAARRIDKAI